MTQNIRPPTIEESLAPRHTLLTGTAELASVRGEYVITFPHPNECVRLGPVRASSRAEALYRAVSLGGFTLALAQHGALTVWTIEEWEEAEKSMEVSLPGWRAKLERRCAEKKQPEKPN